MPDLQVVINHYGETDMLRGTLDSVTTVVPEATVLVLDGRYANFHYPDVDGDTTPATENLCSTYESVEYRRPPDDRLPFGEGTGRRPIHAKAEWVWYEQADPETWTLKIDDDERLRRFDVDLSTLDREQKHAVSIAMPSGDRIDNARLWIPDEWTFYVDDICMPRDEYPRDLSFEKLRAYAGPAATWTRLSRDVVDDVQVVNRGGERSRGYQETRKKQVAEFEDD